MITFLVKLIYIFIKRLKLIIVFIVDRLLLWGAKGQGISFLPKDTSSCSLPGLGKKSNQNQVPKLRQQMTIFITSEIHKAVARIQNTEFMFSGLFL